MTDDPTLRALAQAVERAQRDWQNTVLAVLPSGDLRDPLWRDATAINLKDLGYGPVWPTFGILPGTKSANGVTYRKGEFCTTVPFAYYPPTVTPNDVPVGTWVDGGVLSYVWFFDVPSDHWGASEPPETIECTSKPEGSTKTHAKLAANRGSGRPAEYGFSPDIWGATYVFAGVSVDLPSEAPRMRYNTEWRNFAPKCGITFGEIKRALDEAIAAAQVYTAQHQAGA